MGPSGLEPLASSLSGTRSNQLSYAPEATAWDPHDAASAVGTLDNAQL